MKFIASSATLLRHLSSINGVITTNPVVPILENFLFEIEEDAEWGTADLELPNKPKEISIWETSTGVVDD